MQRIRRLLDRPEAPRRALTPVFSAGILALTAAVVLTAWPSKAGAKAPAKGGDTPPEKDKDEKKDKDKDKDKDEKKGKDKGEKKDEKKDKDKKGKDGEGEKAPAQPFKLPESAILAAVIVAALTIGSLLGSLLIAPRVIAARNAQPAAPARAPDGGEETRESGPKKNAQEKPAVYRIDNIVVNPAGSAGARFLMASVAFELPDEKTASALREREVEVRDAVIATFESQTLEMLAAPGARDGLNQKLAGAVGPLVPGKRRPRGYLPQFVIQ